VAVYRRCAVALTAQLPAANLRRALDVLRASDSRLRASLDGVTPAAERTRSYPNVQGGSGVTLERSRSVSTCGLLTPTEFARCDSTGRHCKAGSSAVRTSIFVDRRVRCWHRVRNRLLSRPIEHRYLTSRGLRKPRVRVRRGCNCCTRTSRTWRRLAPAGRTTSNLRHSTGNANCRG